MYWRAKYRQAKALRDSGLTFREVAERMDVGERTVRRWFQIQLEDEASERHFAPSSNAWPGHRKWPVEWTAEHLISAGIRDRNAAERILMVVTGAKKGRARWVEWFLTERLRLDFAESEKPESERIPTEAAAWRDLLAAAPVLAEWLDAPEAMGIQAMVQAYQPYIGDASAKKGYAAAARSPVNRLKDRVVERYWQTASTLDLGNSPGPEAALMEFLDRLPMVGQVKRGSQPLSGLFIEMFRHEPKGEHRGKSY